MTGDSGGQLVEITGLTKAFGAVRAVDGLDMVVRPGRVTGFLGPNGAGKTTTFRMLLGLVGADAGQALRPRPPSSLPRPDHDGRRPEHHL